MACQRPFGTVTPYTGGGGSDIDCLVDVVSRLSNEGLLEDFSRSHPQYMVGVEVTRAIVGNRSRGGRSSVSFSTPPPAPSTPSASSIRYFVTLIAQLLEEQCPMRNDPNILQSEDKCLAALQVAINDCLKIVRRKRNALCSSRAPCEQRQGSNKQPPQNCFYGMSEIPPPPLDQINAPNGISPALARQLDSIPEPECEEQCEVEERPPPCDLPPKSPNSHHDDGCDKFAHPVAGRYSDGLGGHKIKCFPPVDAKTGTLDGVGGSKVKGIED